MVFYEDSFRADVGFNIGIITSIVLIAILIFMELPIASVQGRKVATLGRLRIRLSTLMWILLIIFLGMVYTKVVMVISG